MKDLDTTAFRRRIFDMIRGNCLSQADVAFPKDQCKVSKTLSFKQDILFYWAMIAENSRILL